MDLRTVLHVLRERWVIVVVTTVVAALGGAGLTWQQTPTYAAKATLFVSAWNGGNDTSSAYQAACSPSNVSSRTPSCCAANA